MRLGWSSEKAMAPHSSTLAWKIPWTEEPDRLQSMGLLRAGHDWVTELNLVSASFSEKSLCWMIGKALILFLSLGPSIHRSHSIYPITALPHKLNTSMFQDIKYQSWTIKSWAPKNWCFWTVVLEKISESLLDCKEIKPVNPKGNQSWVFVGRTDAEAKAPILWLPDVTNWFIKKDPDAGKDWRQEKNGTREDKMVGWHHRLNGHEFE